MSEKEFLDIFGDNLRDAMIDADISQNQLAYEIDTDKATISRYVNKKVMPSLPVFINICVALNCNPEDLVPMYDYIY